MRISLRKYASSFLIVKLDLFAMTVKVAGGLQASRDSVSDCRSDLK
jgi:uncharacterized membrane protein